MFIPNIKKMKKVKYDDKFPLVLLFYLSIKSLNRVCYDKMEFDENISLLIITFD